MRHNTTQPHTIRYYDFPLSARTANDANPSFKADVSISITPCRFLDPHSPFWTIALLAYALFPLTVVILPLLYVFFLSSSLPVLQASLFTPHYIFSAIPHTHTSLYLPPFHVFHPSREVKLNQLCILSFYPIPAFTSVAFNLKCARCDICIPRTRFLVLCVLLCLLFSCSFVSLSLSPSSSEVIYSFFLNRYCIRSHVHLFQSSCGFISLHTSLARGSSIRKERLARAGRCVCRTRVCRGCVRVIYCTRLVISW